MIKEYTLYGIIPIKRMEYDFNLQCLIPNKFWMFYFKLFKINMTGIFYRSYGKNYFQAIYNKYKNIKQSKKEKINICTYGVK